MYHNLGIIGFPLHHTLSPTLHTYFLSQSGLNGGYNCFEVGVDKIPELLDFFKTYHFSGFNITVPYKKEIMQYLDEIDADAAFIDAVNTVVVSPAGEMKGYNTDIDGVTETLRLHEIDLLGKNVFVLGAGGTTKTVLAALRQNQCESVSIFARTPAKAEDICCSMGITDYNILDISTLNNINECDTIINTTSLGLNGERFLDLSALKCNEAAIDLQYGKTETSFLKEFSGSSIKKIDGITMLIFQGLKAFKLWTGFDFEIDLEDIIKRLGVS